MLVKQKCIQIHQKLKTYGLIQSIDHKLQKKERRRFASIHCQSNHVCKHIFKALDIGNELTHNLNNTVTYQPLLTTIKVGSRTPKWCLIG